MKSIGTPPPISARIIPIALHPVERCVCCWKNVHPRKPYPSDWSSTLCDVHREWTMEQRRSRHAY